MTASKRLYDDDTEMYRLFENELFVTVVGDVMDTIGLRHQFLPPVFKPVDEKTRLLRPVPPICSIVRSSAVKLPIYRHRCPMHAW